VIVAINSQTELIFAGYYGYMFTFYRPFVVQLLMNFLSAGKLKI